MLANEIRAQRYALRSDVVATVLEDGVLLFDLETKYFYRLNESGWAIVQLFESGAALQDVLARCEALGSPPQDQSAILAVFERLTDDRLIEAASGDEAIPAEGGVTGFTWTPPTIEKQAEPLQKVIISAFDPSVPLVE